MAISFSLDFISKMDHETLPYHACGDEFLDFDQLQVNGMKYTLLEYLTFYLDFFFLFLSERYILAQP